MTTTPTPPALLTVEQLSVEDMQEKLTLLAKDLRRMAGNVEDLVPQVPKNSSVVLSEVIHIASHSLSTMKLDILVNAEARIRQARTAITEAAHATVLDEARAGSVTIETAGA